MAKHRLASAIEKILVFILVVSAGLCIFYYLLQVWFRVSEDKWCTQVSSNHDGAYTVQYAYVAENWIVLRLRKTGDDKLLAERTYQFTGGIDLTWVDDGLIYNTSDDSFPYQGTIHLPPAKFDRWLSYLP